MYIDIIKKYIKKIFYMVLLDCILLSRVVVLSQSKTVGNLNESNSGHISKTCSASMTDFVGGNSR